MHAIRKLGIGTADNTLSGIFTLFLAIKYNKRCMPKGKASTVFLISLIFRNISTF